MTNQVIPAEAVEAAAKLIYRTSGRKRVMSYEQARPTCEDEAQLILEAAAPYIRAASAANLRGWYDERMSEESAPDVTLTDYEHGREVGTTEGILAAALLIEAETK